MSERELIGLGGLVLLFFILALRVPVGLAMIGIGIGGNYVLSLFFPFLRFEPYLQQFKSLFYGIVSNYELSVVPLFVLMGYLASQANLSRDLFQGVNAILGRFRGGVAMAAIGACAGFGAVCGSSLATASTMGKVALPSVALVIYAVTVEASIIQMFQAAIIPGLIAVAFFMGVIAIQVRLNPSLAPIPEPMAPAERREALLRLIPVIVIFGSIILGLGAGLFTPTPAAGVGVFAILVYGAYMRLRGKGGLTFSGLKQSLRDTAVTTSMIFFILLGAEILKGFFSRANLPAYMAEAAATSGLDPWLIMVLMLLALIVLGCFMESLSMIVVIIPFFWPALVDINGGDWATAATAAYGMGAEDLKIWFGILALIVVELGLITPPVGLNVFIIYALADGVHMIVRIMLLIFVPVLTLFVPTFLGG